MTAKEQEFSHPNIGDVAISAVLPYPNADEVAFIELTNTTKTAFSLSGCTLENLQSRQRINSFILEPKTGHQFSGNSIPSLSHTGKERISLVCNQIIIDTLERNIFIPKGFLIEPKYHLHMAKNVNKIPDIPRYIITYSDDTTLDIVINHPLRDIQNIALLSISAQEKEERIFQILQESFVYDIDTKEENIYITGNTLPSMRIAFTLERENEDISPDVFRTVSDIYGRYSFSLPLKNIPRQQTLSLTPSLEWKK